MLSLFITQKIQGSYTYTSLELYIAQAACFFFLIDYYEVGFLKKN